MSLPRNAHLPQHVRMRVSSSGNPQRWSRDDLEQAESLLILKSACTSPSPRSQQWRQAYMVPGDLSIATISSDLVFYSQSIAFPERDTRTVSPDACFHLAPSLSIVPRDKSVLQPKAIQHRHSYRGNSSDTAEGRSEAPGEHKTQTPTSRPASSAKRDVAPQQTAVLVSISSRKRRKVSKRRPKRPLTAYNLFYKERRAQLVQKPLSSNHGHVPSSSRQSSTQSTPAIKIPLVELTKQVAEEWNALSDKSKYQERARQLQEAYKAEMSVLLHEERMLIEAMVKGSGSSGSE